MITRATDVRLFFGRRVRFWGAIVSAAVMLFLAAGCGDKARDAAASAASAEERYPFVGEVISVDPEARILVVHHEEIPDYMPEMVMEFSVSAADAANARAGQHIRAELLPREDGPYRLVNIWPADPLGESLVSAGADALRQDTMIRGRSAYREVGESIPGFTLYDQSGAVVQSARFRGKQVMINFIYTRCPVPNMCPAATMKMMEVQALAAEAGISDLELISITLDPEYDTPGVLRAYSEARGIDNTNFSFLTGPERAIRDLLAQFGVLVKLEGPLINHTLATLLIDKDGRIIHRADGTQWEPRDFVAKMHRP
ncbi:electron transporter SenC [Cephaloticoccus primus]|uniref:Electron transporter SenC n=2 Tax=Cephaloticoccus primus TaxID=1548207 RepID=A0A139SJ24_9BACT|nr:electron transporter SenC [Cephaloticoccus primus]